MHNADDTRAPCEIWNNWNIARMCEEGRVAIAANNICRNELADWFGTPPIRRVEIRFALNSFARQHR